MLEICRGDKDGRLGAMGQYDYSRPRRVCLGQVCDSSRNRGKVGRRREPVSFGVCLSFGLIPDHDVAVRQEAVELRLEELGDERRRKIRGKNLVWVVSAAT